MSTGWVRLNVALGYVPTSMMRILNESSRALRSLRTDATSTLKLPAVSLPAATVSDPVMVLVRPTAMLLAPNSVSFTRYPATDPAPTCQVPS